MNEPIKQPQTAEQSLRYIAWSLKDITKELQSLNAAMNQMNKIMNDKELF